MVTVSGPSTSNIFPERESRLMHADQSTNRSPFERVFTVFTSAYNRADTIHGVYESLKAQTYHDFEWLVVDAGSDETETTIERFSKEAPFFPIRYFRQENRGKHGAINYALELAHGKFFLIIDDDDQCVPSALERFKALWDSIPDAEKPGFAGIGVLCMDDSGNILGSKFPQDIMDAHWGEIIYKYRIKGDKWLLFSTEILREFPMPEAPSLRIIPEGMIFSQIGKKYKMRFANEALRYYRRDDRQLTAGSPEDHAQGNAITLLATLNQDIEHFRHYPSLFMRFAVQYGRFSLHAGRRITDQFRSLNSPKARLIFMAAFPVSLMIYCKDRFASHGIRRHV